MGRELSFQLQPGMFAPGKVTQSARLEVGALPALAGNPVDGRSGGSLLLHDYATAAASAGLATPTAARIFDSISAAISRCSLKNSRALSLPWPILSPL